MAGAEILIEYIEILRSSRLVLLGDFNYFDGLCFGIRCLLSHEFSSLPAGLPYGHGTQY